MPTSVVISILAPNLAIGEVGGFPNGAAEGGVMEFEILATDPRDDDTAADFPGVMSVTISINSFANGATSADYELLDSVGDAIDATVSTDVFDLYPLVIDPADANSHFFQVFVSRDANAEPLVSDVNAESITIALAEPSAVSAGYRRLPSELAGLTRRLGNAPVIVGFGDNTPTFVEEGRMTEITVTLEVAPAAGESFEFRFGVLGTAIAPGVPAVAILNDAAGVVCRPSGNDLLCESSFF